MKPHLVVAVTLCASVVAAAQQSPNTRPALSARLDSAVRHRKDAADRGGGDRGVSIAVAVMRGRDTLLLRAYGLADVEAKRPATPHAIYEVGSLTKQITAAAIMRLVEEGKVDLDADIDRYVPSFPLQGHHVKVRHLLNHTSGIHNYTAGKEWRKHWNEDLTPDAVIAFVARDTFDFAPGTRNAYSNTGYTLLGMVIEKASGKSYAAFVEQELFKPLGLREMGYCASHPTDTMAAKGYTTEHKRPERATYLSMTIPYSAGSICASVADFAAWERAFHGGRVVGAASYQRMMTPDTLNNGARLNYGFGMAIGLLSGHPAAIHGGQVNGFTSAQVYLPKDSVTVVVFTNDEWATPEIITLDLARMVIGVPATGRGALDRPTK